MNNQLVDLYQRQAAVKPKMDESELIDISSEDSEEEAAYNSFTKTNGASTSKPPSLRTVIVPGYVNSKPTVRLKLN